MKDFSRARPKIQFQVDDHIYYGIDAMPAEDMVDILAKLQGVNDDDIHQVYAMVQHVARELMDKPSADIFVQRMGRGSERPIDFEQANEIVMWLMEQYGGRPTMPSGSSGVGLPSPTSGQSLTGSTPDAVSISSASPGTDS